MILSIIVILAVGIIAYVHYVGGLLSGLVSAVLAAVATAVAMTYYEPLAEALSGGKYNDQSQGICLLALFALVYLLGRLAFDSLVPGNVRLPAIADGIGGAVCGLIAGMLAMGIVTIALQSMPFGPSVAGYARYALNDDHDGRVPPSSNNPAALDRKIYDELKNDDLEKGSSGMILPVDDLVVSLVKHLSADGALANDKPFESIHPDLLQELFGQRLGIEVGAKRTATNKAGTQVEVTGAYLVPPLPMTPSEFPTLRKEQREEKGTLSPQPGMRLLAVTVMFKNDAADIDDHLVRISTGSVRLVTPVLNSAGDKIWKNNYPIGTVQQNKAWMNKPDDFLFVNVSKEDRGVHFLFQVDESALIARTAAPAKGAAAGKPVIEGYGLAPESFIEVKRTAKLPLDNVNVVAGWPPVAQKYFPVRKLVFYKEDETAPVAPAPVPAPVTPAPVTPAPVTPTPTVTPAPVTPPPAGGDNGWAQAPLEKPVVAAGNALPFPIEAGTADAEAEVVTTSASGHITAKQFDVLEVEGAAKADLTKGDHPVAQLLVPAGKRMVQVTLTPKAGGDPWAWAANLGEYTVVDNAGVAYKPFGVIVLAQAGANQKLVAAYKAAAEVAKVNKTDGVPASVTLVYLIPADQKAKEIQFQAKAGGLPLEK